MKKKISGYVHIHIKKGKIVNAFSHLSNFPKDCVIHTKIDEVLSRKEFEKSHKSDKEELKAPPERKVYDLGDDVFKKN